MSDATSLPHVVIYTDGGASPNPGSGGWAAILAFGEFKKELKGGELETTNNRMELIIYLYMFLFLSTLSYMVIKFYVIY